MPKSASFNYTLRDLYKQAAYVAVPTLSPRDTVNRVKDALPGLLVSVSKSEHGSEIFLVQAHIPKPKLRSQL